MTIILSLVYNLLLMLVILFVIAFSLMLILNPTASPKEIFNYWAKTYRGETR